MATTTSAHSATADPPALLPRVAIIGAGLSGAACANKLASLGTVSVTCFDMGQRPGGRASTRRDTASGCEFDHGCQFFRASPTGAFKELLKGWQAQGLVQPWKARVGHYDVPSGRFTRREDVTSSTTNDRGFFDVLRPGPLYVAVPSMGRLAADLVTGRKLLDLKQGIRVQKAHMGTDGRWLLDGCLHRPDAPPSPPPAGASSTNTSAECPEPARIPVAVEGGAARGGLGRFDAIVFADSLVGRPGGGAQVQVTGTVGAIRPFMTRLELLERVPLFTLLVAFPADGPDAPVLPFDAATLSGSRGLRWVCNNSAKPGRALTPPPAGSPEGTPGLQCWTAITTPEFAQLLFGEQSSSGTPPVRNREYLDMKAKQLFEVLKAELRPILGQDLPAPAYLSVQRWGSAYVSTPLGEQCASDAVLKFAACGDFCGGASVESAVLSGLAAADAVVAMLGGPTSEPDGHWSGAH